MIKLTSNLVREKEGTRRGNKWDIKKLFWKMILNSGAYFGSLKSSRPNEHMLIAPSKGEKIQG